MERTSKPWEASSSLPESGHLGKGKAKANRSDLSVTALHNQLLQSVALPTSKRNRQRDAYGGAARSSSPSSSSYTRSKSPETPRPSYTSTPSHSSISNSVARSPRGSQYGQSQNHLPPPLAASPKPSTRSIVISPPITPLHMDQDDGRLTPPPSYEETELDAFLTRIALNPDGATYEDLLLLDEINGPASVVQQRNLGTAEQPLNVSVASVELLHKRTTQDGRFKLKLMLAGLRVDTCGICLAQFKAEEKGAITVCKHYFHEECLQKWIARKDSCPTCRQGLRDTDVN